MLVKEMLKLAKGVGCGQSSPRVWEGILKILWAISTQLSRHKDRGNTWVGTIAIVDDTKPENAFCEMKPPTSDTVQVFPSWHCMPENPKAEATPHHGNFGQPQCGHSHLGVLVTTSVPQPCAAKDSFSQPSPPSFFLALVILEASRNQPEDQFLR